MMDMTIADPERVILDRLERYYDTVPRVDTRIEDFGPLRLFVREGEGWPYYARPTPGWSGAVDVADVDKVRHRQRALGISESFEWVAETTPELRGAAEASGLVVHEHPLMVFDPTVPTIVPEAPAGLSVRVVGPEDPALPSALAVPYLAFDEPGTQVGAADRAELAQAVKAQLDDGSLERAIGRIQAGVISIAAAIEDGTALCAGQHKPVGEVTEIAGVGTLPAARRRGLAAVVTRALMADATSRSVRTIFLSAASDDVARIYGRLGFRHLGTALVAEPPE